ncbi:MAG TPA: serine protease [Phycisphaerae bacterium]|nr:serine protease [Phycisphaerae bacterium]
MITASSHGTADIPFRWDRPLFTAVDGIGPTGRLSVMEGMVLAFGHIDESGSNVCGSGVMVAPGVLITATHVTEVTAGMTGMAFSFLPRRRMRLWSLRERHIMTRRLTEPTFDGPPRVLASDVSLVSCELASDPCAKVPLRMAHLEVALPRRGERLWAVGYRETSRGETNGMTMLCSSGVVTQCHLQGRGSHLPGPCVEVAMNTLGGMSGGPVFNAEGHVVGIVSSSFEAEDSLGPTFVSLIWPALVGQVTAPWPTGLWPGGEADLQAAQKVGHARAYGEVSWSRKKGFSGRLPTVAEKR